MGIAALELFVTIQAEKELTPKSELAIERLVQNAALIVNTLVTHSLSTVELHDRQVSSTRDSRSDLTTSYADKLTYPKTNDSPFADITKAPPIF